MNDEQELVVDGNEHEHTSDSSDILLPHLVCEAMVYKGHDEQISTGFLQSYNRKYS